MALACEPNGRTQTVAVQTGEGTLDIIYTPASLPAGPNTYGGYIARPTYRGQWPTVLIFGPHPKPTSTVRDWCRILARHGIAALAPDLTESHIANRTITRSVAAFLKDPTGEWSNAQLGYGVLAFGAGLYDLAPLAADDRLLTAGVSVAGTFDEDTAATLAGTDMRGLSIVSRADESVDVSASLDQRDALPTTTFVVYPTGDEGFWDVAADGFDEQRYEDTVKRVVEFFTEHLPARI